MAKKKQPAAPREKPRRNTPLLFLLLILLPMYGGYYLFSSLAAGAVLSLLLLHAVRRDGALRLPTGPEAWCLYALWGCTLLAVPFAVSPGMAFAGVLRLTVWALFFLYALYPADLSLAENRLQSFPDVVGAEPVADAILASTDLSLSAWDCKLAACAQRRDVSGMVKSKYQYLRLSRYRGEVYQEFTDLLENACAQGPEAEFIRYQALAQAVIAQLEEVNQTTSPLAYRIVDKPELDFSPQICGRLNQIIERIDTQ